MSRRPPCKCGAKGYPHRHDHWCDAWAARQDDERFADEDDSEEVAALDYRDRVRDVQIDELNRRK